MHSHHLNEFDIVTMLNRQISFLSKLLAELGSPSSVSSVLSSDSVLSSEEKAVFAIRRWLRFVLLVHEADDIWPYFTPTDVGKRVWPLKARKCWWKVEKREIASLSTAISEVLDENSATLRVVMDSLHPDTPTDERFRILICYLTGSKAIEEFPGMQDFTVYYECSSLIIEPTAFNSTPLLLTPFCHVFMRKHLVEALSSVFMTPSATDLVVSSNETAQESMSRAPRVRQGVRQRVPDHAMTGRREHQYTIPQVQFDRHDSKERQERHITTPTNVPQLKPPLIDDDEKEWTTVVRRAKSKLRPLRPVKNTNVEREVKRILQRPPDLREFPQLPSSSAREAGTIKNVAISDIDNDDLHDIDLQLLGFSDDLRSLVGIGFCIFWESLFAGNHMKEIIPRSWIYIFQWMGIFLLVIGSFFVGRTGWPY